MSKHQKRLSSPKDYPIERKDGTYVAKAEGPHAADEGLPLVVVLRDMLGYAENESEVKQVLTEEKVLVDGRPRKNYLSTVGFMDVLSIPAADEAYRVTVTGDGFALVDADDADTKIARIDDKTTLKGGMTQLNLHDGNNIETGEEYDTHSSLVVSVPDLEVTDEIAFEEGNVAFIAGGRHAGVVATITEISPQLGTRPTQVMLETDDGETVETVKEHVYVIGEDDPEVVIDG